MSRGASGDDEPSPPPAPSPQEQDEEPRGASPGRVLARPAEAIETSRQISEGLRWIAGQVAPALVTLRGASISSGVIVRPDGCILTTNHTLGSAPAVTVYAGTPVKTHTGKVLARDAANDLAVVKIDAAGLPCARLGDSDALKVGEWVVALGTQFGLPQSFSPGVISYIGRKRKTVDAPMLQTSALIDPNMPGGPLVNLDGEVVGLCHSVFGRTFVGIGYAVPINVFKQKLWLQLQRPPAAKQ